MISINAAALTSDDFIPSLLLRVAKSSSPAVRTGTSAHMRIRGPLTHSVFPHCRRPWTVTYLEAGKHLCSHCHTVPRHWLTCCVKFFFHQRMLRFYFKSIARNVFKMSICKYEATFSKNHFHSHWEMNSLPGVFLNTNVNILFVTSSPYCLLTHLPKALTA